MGRATDCYVCTVNATADLPPRDRIVETEHWRVAHAFDSSLPGWLVLVARSHVAALDDLPTCAHRELGELLGSLSAGLRVVVGCSKTYVMQFSEAAGFGHLHVHLVPRMPDQPADRLGPAVFGYLGAAEDERVPTDDMDRIALALRGT